MQGQKFGRLTVIERVENNSRNKPQWLCSCECGNTCVVSSELLKRGAVKSCGCAVKDGSHRRTHGGCGTRLYQIWKNMKNRCYNPKIREYQYYGYRGITICESWLNSFESFRDWAVNNGYKDNLSIDRIDVNGNYEPSNCRWATKTEQLNNTRRNKLLTYNGRTMTVTKWAEELGISVTTLWSRLYRYKMPISEALKGGGKDCNAK